MRAAAHYLSSIVVLSVYGVQVCHFLESLRPDYVIVPIASVQLFQLFLYRFLYKQFVQKAPYARQTTRSFLLHLTLFNISGLTLMVFNVYVHGFPLESGLKVMVGFAMLGFFAAVDLALSHEREIIDHFRETGTGIEPDEKIFPVTRKLSIFAVACALFMVGIFFFVLNKDLDWLGTVGRGVPLEKARRSILIEVGFITGVVLAHVLNIIYSYTRNLSSFFNNENRVLTGASLGDFNMRVPVSTNDEFGIMARYTNDMVIGLRDRTEELQNTRDVTINALASLAETRNNETGAHILRTQNYVKVLAEYLVKKNIYAEYLTPDKINLLFKSVPLHDIGKVGIPDAILLKPAKLTDEEFKLMKHHSWLGANALRIAEEKLGSNSFLKLAGEIALTHHEKWDGTGYPGNLAGDDIPVSGRLMAIADVYDALVSRRVYKESITHEETMKIINEGKGSHFDPVMVDAFSECGESIRGIAMEFSDRLLSPSANQ